MFNFYPYVPLLSLELSLEACVLILSYTINKLRIWGGNGNKIIWDQNLLEAPPIPFPSIYSNPPEGCIGAGT